MQVQSEFLQSSSSWPFHTIVNSSVRRTAALHQWSTHPLDHDHDGFDFFSSFTSDVSSGISSDSRYPTTVTFSEVGFPPEFPILQDEIPIMSPVEPISSGEFEDVCRWFEENDATIGMNINSCTSQQTIPTAPAWSPCQSTKSSDASVITAHSMNESPEIDHQSGIRHLLTAYGEAMEMGQRELAQVIVRCVNEKVNPVGETLERVAFNLFQSRESQGVYLKQESIKNFEAAFKAFYQIFPYGRVAHFAANCAILESMPQDAETIHIVDFDMGEGIQWSPLIEAIGWRQHKGLLRLTSIKSREEDGCGCAPSRWRFEETARRLHDHARLFGLKLKVEEMEMKDLKKRDCRREWVAFNCMTLLPHMGRRRCRSHVIGFLRAAKELLGEASRNKGIVTFAEGEAAGDRVQHGHGYGSFFDDHILHYQALYDSIELTFPNYLGEARLAMESLFIAPYACSFSWCQKWEEMCESSDLPGEFGLEALRLSEESLREAKEIAREGNSFYRIKTEGKWKNEMLLEWKNIALVRVSTWM